VVNCVIYPAEGESADSIIRRFRKSTDKAGTYRDYLRAREFIPRPQRRAMKSSKARAQAKKDGRT
jgi:ribosomal protein S21